MSASGQIRSWFLNGGSLSEEEARARFGVARLAPYVDDLKKQEGWAFSKATDPATGRDRYILARIADPAGRQMAPSEMPLYAMGCGWDGGVTYFARADETGRIKIGWTSKSPEERCGQWKTGSSEPVTIVATVPQSKQENAAVLRRFRAHRVRGAGKEWHHPVPELLAYIERYGRPFKEASA